MLWLALLLATCDAASYGSLGGVRGRGPIAMDGVGLVLGDTETSFALYEHTLSSWVLRHRLMADKNFVSGSVAIEGDLIAVAHMIQPGLTPGGLYVYSWTPGSGLAATDLQPVFNSSAYSCRGVHIHNTTVFCGECNYQERCAVFVFERNKDTTTWDMVQTLLPPDANNTQVFGGRIAGGGSVLVVGDAWYGGMDYGATFFYGRTGSSGGWGLVEQVNGTHGGEELSSGIAVSPDESVVAVGSHLEIGVRFFRRAKEGSGWEQSDVVKGDQLNFGFDVAFFANGTRFVVASSVGVNVYETATRTNGAPHQVVALDGIKYYRPGILAADASGRLFAMALENDVQILGLTPPPIPTVVIALTVLILAALIVLVVAFFVVRRIRARSEYTRL